jgi:hypothetical protein
MQAMNSIVKIGDTSIHTEPKNILEVIKEETLMFKPMEDTVEVTYFMSTLSLKFQTTFLLRELLHFYALESPCMTH